MTGIDLDSSAHASSFCYQKQVAKAASSACYGVIMSETNIQAWRAQRLKHAIDEFGGGNVTAFGKRLGYKDGAFVRQMLSGARPISEKTVRAVEALPGLAGWFNSDRQASEVDATYTPTGEEFTLVPQLDVAAACGDGKFQDHIVVKGGLAFKRSSLRDFGLSEKYARIIYAAGGSMSPTIQDGCVVLLDTTDTQPKDGKVYAICAPDGGLVLKRLVRDYHPAIGGLAWIMRSDNPDKTAHPDKVLPPDDRTMIAGRAVWNDNRL